MPPPSSTPRLGPLAAFQVSLHGRFWVSLEGEKVRDENSCYEVSSKPLLD